MIITRIVVRIVDMLCLHKIAAIQSHSTMVRARRNVL